MRTILSVEDLHISYSNMGEKFQVIRGISFHLNEGETLAIVGESGSGKSVTARAIIGLNSKVNSTVESGKIFYQGRNLIELPEERIREIRGCEIAMIFQDPAASLNPTMRIGKQIEENVRTSSKEYAYKRTIELLNLVGIPEAKTRYNLYPHELSGGMRQRVMIAIALASEPKILIADEPTTALDVTIQAQILDLLKEIQESMKMSIIYITHDLSLVAGFCNRIVVMYAGMIVEQAQTKELFEHPYHPYTSKLIKSIPRLDQKKSDRLIPIEGSPPSLMESICGCGFTPRCDRAKSICKKTQPNRKNFSETQEVACWLYE